MTNHKKEITDIINNFLDSNNNMLSACALVTILKNLTFSKADLINVLTQNNKVSKISFPENFFEGNYIDELCQIIRNKSNLRRLSLSNNKFTIKDFEKICQELENNQSIEEIFFCKMNLNDEHYLKMANMLAKNRTIRILHLTGNYVSNIATDHLAEAVEINEGLTEIFISREMMSLEARKTLKEAVKLNHNIIYYMYQDTHHFHYALEKKDNILQLIKEKDSGSHILSEENFLEICNGQEIAVHHLLKTHNSIVFEEFTRSNLVLWLAKIFPAGMESDYSKLLKNFLTEENPGEYLALFNFITNKILNHEEYCQEYLKKALQKFIQNLDFKYDYSKDEMKKILTSSNYLKISELKNALESSKPSGNLCHYFELKKEIDIQQFHEQLKIINVELGSINDDMLDDDDMKIDEIYEKSQNSIEENLSELRQTTFLNGRQILDMAHKCHLVDEKLLLFGDARILDNVFAEKNKSFVNMVGREEPENSPFSYRILKNSNSCLIAK